MRSSTTGVNVVGAASSSTNATTFSAAGVTVVDASSCDRFDLDISTLGSSRATPGAVYDSMTAGVVAVSSTVRGGSTSATDSWSSALVVNVTKTPVVIALLPP